MRFIWIYIGLIFCISSPVAYSGENIPIKQLLNDVRDQFAEFNKKANKSEFPMVVPSLHFEMNVVAEVNKEGKAEFYILTGSVNKKDVVTQNISFDVTLPKNYIVGNDNIQDGKDVLSHKEAIPKRAVDTRHNPDGGTDDSNKSNYKLVGNTAEKIHESESMPLNAKSGKCFARVNDSSIRSENKPVKWVPISCKSKYTHSIIKRLQEKLRGSGDYIGEINGKYTPDTAQAITNYQLKNNLDMSGITLELLSALMIEL